MREFIELAQGMLSDPRSGDADAGVIGLAEHGPPASTLDGRVPCNEANGVPQPGELLAELRQLKARLLNFMVPDSESGSETYKIGVETGMQRAGDMVRNLLEHHGLDGE